MQIMGKAEIDMLLGLIEHYQEILPTLMEDFTTLFNRATTKLDPVNKRLVVIKLLHYKNELISERKSMAFHKLGRRTEPAGPNEVNPQMGQLEQQRQETGPQRQQNNQQNLYRPRSQQRNKIGKTKTPQRDGKTIPENKGKTKEEEEEEAACKIWPN